MFCSCQAFVEMIQEYSLQGYNLAIEGKDPPNRDNWTPHRKAAAKLITDLSEEYSNAMFVTLQPELQV